MKCNRQSGQALVFVGLSLVVLVAVVGLAIDMGYLRYTKRRLQPAAAVVPYAAHTPDALELPQAAAFTLMGLRL